MDKYITDLPEKLREICDPFKIKSPFDEGLVSVSVRGNNERIRQLAETRSTNKIFEAYYNLCGVLPAVNCIGYNEKSDFPDNWGGLTKAHAIYRGLKRPCTEHGNDSVFYTYVTKPRFRYKYTPSMVCPAKRVDVAENYLFVCVISFEDDQELGEILNWEWVEASTENSLRPVDFSSRYETEVWTNE